MRICSDLASFYEHVVHVDLNVPPNLMCDHLVHQPLIRGTRILEFEWNYFVVEETLLVINEVFS